MNYWSYCDQFHINVTFRVTRSLFVHFIFIEYSQLKGYRAVLALTQLAKISNNLG